MSPGHFAPPAQRTPQVRFASCLPQLSMQPPTLPGTAASPPRQAPRQTDQSGPPKSWYRPRTSFPGRRSPRWQKKQWCSPCPSWPPRGYPAGSLLGAADWPMGTVTIGQPGGFVSAEPKTALRQPAGNLMLSAENIEKFPLNEPSTRACWWRNPATRCPMGRQRAGSGAGPRQRRLPPAVPGAPLRLRHRPHRRPPVRPSANRSCQRHCPIGPLGVPALAASGLPLPT